MMDYMNQTYRYPGVTPFSTAQKSLFMGREKDIEAFYQLLFVKQLVILYGKSGYGKSSLINAGIIPKLEQSLLNKAKYFQIRLYTQEKGNVLGGISNSPHDTLIKHLSNDVQELDFMLPLKAKISEDDHFWYWIKQHQYKNNNTPIIFFFDQFEELFSYSEQEIDAFAAQIGHLLYQTLPEECRSIIEHELFQSLSHEQIDFLYEKPNVKIVFSIRADRMSLLNRLTKYLPNLLQHHYELDAISEESARMAIEKPSQIISDTFLSPNFSFESTVIDSIIKRVKNDYDGKIETAALQIICRFIEEHTVIEQQKLVITEAVLGNIKNIFKNYYQSALNKLEVTEQENVRRTLEDKFIQNNRRIPFESNHIQQEYGFSEQVLRQLEDSTLLRKERDSYGRYIYEIGHDTLIEPILEFSSKRRQEELKIKIRRRFYTISGAMFVLLGILTVIGYLYYEADSSKDEALKARDQADSLRIQATHALNQVYLQQARSLKDNIDNLERNGGIPVAKYYCDSATNILNRIDTSTDLDSKREGIMLQTEISKIKNRIK